MNKETIKAEIMDLVNVRVWRKDSNNFDPDYHQLNGNLYTLKDSSDKANEDIEIVENTAFADIDDVDDLDFISYDIQSDAWEDYQKSYDITVNYPYDEFFNCNQEVVNLLQKHCSDKERVIKILKTLSEYDDYSGTTNIKLLYSLAKLMLNLPDSLIKSENGCEQLIANQYGSNIIKEKNIKKGISENESKSEDAMDKKRKYHRISKD